MKKRRTESDMKITDRESSSIYIENQEKKETKLHKNKVEVEEFENENENKNKVIR